LKRIGLPLQSVRVHRKRGFSVILPELNMVASSTSL
jgi:hypothetical protein